MKRPGLWPRSLPGQIVMLAAIALFLAQAINAWLLIAERRAIRTAQATGPAVVRLMDAVDRLNGVRPMRSESRPTGGVRLMSDFPLPAGLPRVPEVESGIRRGLEENNVPLGKVVTGLRRVRADSPVLRRMRPERATMVRHLGAELVIAVEVPGRGWLRLSSPWPRSENWLFGQIIGQTLILYGLVLLPLLWAGHRIARPLRALTQAARRFTPGDGADPVEEHGPSDVRAVIAAYNGLRTRVNAMLDEKDRMLGAIGHDLRTPLAALRVRIESVEDDNDRARMADIITEMNRTLEDILSLARLGRPSEPLNDTDMAALVDAVVDDFRDLDHQVVFEETERTILRLRPSLMRRAVRNLIENAVKYGGGAEVRLVSTPQSIEIEVADRGPGIPEDKLGEVFDPFTRLESSRNRETGGIGLGLALARAIVRDAGGDIRLENRAGGGLIATIRLPR